MSSCPLNVDRKEEGKRGKEGGQEGKREQGNQEGGEGWKKEGQMKAREALPSL